TAPTGFSPNGSNKNDIFRAIYTCDLSFYELSVYNRWGELVYFTDKPQEGWDGVYKGRDAELSVYAWYIRYQKVGSDKLESIQGNVTLIR
ncbi:MAG: gliding motility-associated C-terminal domain-containing protein, partial [Bacteroidetes bacterium]|nr:gliding motility-associated C-terminal domain-containing protein [Bacteroidota bacterium]